MGRTRAPSLLIGVAVVTLEIRSHVDIVQPTVTHASLASMDDRNACSHGWPALPSDLETLLETGEVLPRNRGRSTLTSAPLSWPRTDSPDCEPRTVDPGSR